MNLRGEIAFQTIADKLRYAKHPMDERILNLREDIPIWFLNADNSWIEKHRSVFVQENRPNSFVSVEVIENSGHNLFADQPEKFNGSVQNVFQQIDTIFDEICDKVLLA
jgi:abhydrolase domain-containing protein 4